MSNANRWRAYTTYVSPPPGGVGEQREPVEGVRMGLDGARHFARGMLCGNRKKFPGSYCLFTFISRSTFVP